MAFLRTVVSDRFVRVSGLEADGKFRFYRGGGKSGKLRVVKRPPRNPAALRAR